MFAIGLILCFSAKPIIKSNFQEFVDEQEIGEFEAEEDTEEKEIDDEVEEYLTLTNKIIPTFIHLNNFNINKQFSDHAYLGYIPDPQSPPPQIG